MSYSSPPLLSDHVEIARHQHVPLRYVPRNLTKKDRARQLGELRKSRRMYRQGKYYVRRPVASYTRRRSKHVTRAMRIYGVSSMRPTAELARKTGCTLRTLKKIVNKGRGAYYSSGSRPNQTADSWGYARLASALTGGPAARVDAHLLGPGCRVST
jgi:hypothetical protein